MAGELTGIELRNDLRVDTERVAHSGRGVPATSRTRPQVRGRIAGSTMPSTPVAVARATTAVASNAATSRWQWVSITTGDGILNAVRSRIVRSLDVHEGIQFSTMRPGIRS
jgi:hypothetical protein